MNITENHVRRLLTVVDHGLVRGLGVREPGKFCIEAAVCYALELPHSDDPKCVAQPLRRLKIRLNDSAWSNNMARAKGMRRLAVAQLGSAGVLDKKEFTLRVVTLAIQVYVPYALRCAASVKGNEAHAEVLESAAVACENEPTRANAVKARNVARSAYAAAASYAADVAAAAAATVAAEASYADAASYAADIAAAAVADAVYAAFVADDARAKLRDEVLSGFAEYVVQILIDMKAPGCQWLWLTE